MKSEEGPLRLLTDIRHFTTESWRRIIGVVPQVFQFSIHLSRLSHDFRRIPFYSREPLRRILPMIDPRPHVQKSKMPPDSRIASLYGNSLTSLKPKVRACYLSGADSLLTIISVSTCSRSEQSQWRTKAKNCNCEVRKRHFWNIRYQRLKVLALL